MDLYIQFGYGMMEHSRSLVRAWGSGTVILSPRDLNDKQLRSLSRDIRGLGGRVLLDSQFYLPCADHERLVSHEYWPSGYVSGTFWSGGQLTALLMNLATFGAELGTDLFLLPGVFASTVNDDWLFTQRAILNEAHGLGYDQLELCSTVALGAAAVTNEVQMSKLLEEASSWSCGMIYLVCEHPNGDYLVSDPRWLSGVLDLVAGFRLFGKKVILGYCNHQMLLVAACGANAIASGSWMNVRSFLPEKFRAAYDDEVRRRGVWYYAPDCLSEFPIAYLDMAHRHGILPLLEPSAKCPSRHCENLFAGGQPTTMGFSEPQAFRHYLECLRAQTAAIDISSFAAASQHMLDLMAEGERRLEELRAFDIRGRGRDFYDSLDATRAALKAIEATRGPMMRRKWASL